MGDLTDGGRSCCFTGHRRIPAGEKARLSEALRDVIAVLYEEGFRFFYTGGALGFDTLAAEELLRARERMPGLQLIIVRPCADQDARWTQSQRELYAAQLAAADRVVLLAPSYWSGCMHMRNRYMVERAELCVAYGRREDSGTAHTVGLALAAGLPVVNIAEDNGKNTLI